MFNAATKPNLIAHTRALEAAGIAIKLVMRVPAPLKPIAVAGGCHCTCRCNASASQI